MDNTAKGFAKELISELRRIKKALSFLSEVSEPGKDNKQSPNPKDCTDPEHVSAGWKPLAFTGVDPSPHSTSEAKHKRYRSLQWWKSRTEFVATFFVIGYAVVTFFQWRDAHADFRKDQRAWVGAIKIGPIPEIGKPLTVTITFKNSGKTPALMVSPYYSFQFVNKGDEFRFTVKRTYGHEIIAPNVEAPGVIPLADAKVVWSPVDDSRARKKDNTLYFFGQLWYMDVFKRDHWLNFCYFLEPVGNTYAYTSCNEHNDTDDNY